MAEMKMSGGKNKFAPYDVNGYTISEPLTANNAGNCTWGYAEKYNKRFFIKQFINPKFPAPDADMYKETRARMVAECEKWYNTHAKVYKAVLECGGSNIIYPQDFFLARNTYYLVTEKVNSCGVKFTEIYKSSDLQKQVILKILAYELSRLASKNVIHSDLKPENLILKETAAGFFTVKIIDFDAGFLEEEPPEPDDLTGDQVYFSPEMLLYMSEEDVTITPKSDVFALGIIFHMILCGKNPGYDGGYDCLGQAVLNGGVPEISADIPCELRSLISDMLRADAKERPDAAEVFCRLGGRIPVKKETVSGSASSSGKACSASGTGGESLADPGSKVTSGGLVINMKKNGGK